MDLVQVLHTMDQLGVECLQGLQLLLVIALRQGDTLIKDQPQPQPQSIRTQMAIAKATVLIAKTRVSVISTIHTMTSPSKDRNRPDLKCQILVLLQQILKVYGEEHQSRSTSDQGKIHTDKPSLWNSNLTPAAKLNPKQPCLKWQGLRMGAAMHHKVIRMMAMGANTTKVHQINVVRRLLSKDMTINRMVLHHHHEVHQQTQGQAPALLVSLMVQSQVLMAFPMVLLQASQELAQCPSNPRLGLKEAFLLILRLFALA
jgi:hypothetical protein